MIKLQIKRGTKAALPTLAEGEYGLTTDTKELFIGGPNGNLQIPILTPDGHLPSDYSETFDSLCEKYGYTWSQTNDKDSGKRTIEVIVKQTYSPGAKMTVVLTKEIQSGDTIIDITTTIGKKTTTEKHKLAASGGGEGGPV